MTFICPEFLLLIPCTFCSCLYLGKSIFFFKTNFDSENKWKPVSVAEAYTTTFSHDFRKTRCLLKKCSTMNLENHWTKNFSLKFLRLGFILFLHFSIFLLFWWIFSEGKNFLKIEVAFETCILFVIFYFCKDSSFLILN